MSMNRREFLKQSAIGTGAFAAAVGLPAESYAQKPDMDISGRIDKLIKDGKVVLKDSDGNEFNPAVKFKGKPYILVFGLDDCKFCDKISKNLGEIAKQAKDDMPSVVMLDVLPENDKNDAGIKSLKEKYSENGVSDVTFVFPESKKQAQLLQNKEDGLDAVRNPNEDKSHGMRIALVNKDGKCVAAPLGTNDKCIGEITKAIKVLGREME